MKHWALAAALILSACGDSSTPVAPSEIPTPVAPSGIPGESWSFTVHFVSVTGPDSCLVKERSVELTGTTFSDVPTKIIRSGSSFTISSAFFSDFYGVSFAGTVAGSDFTATGALPSGELTCQDGTVFQQQAGTARVTGSFSTDGRQLTATDVHVYPLVSGGEMHYTWTWMGTRRD
jgi:hypothetical protein